jgi:potassium-transporting ATPase KdpC subunit
MGKTDMKEFKLFLWLTIISGVIYPLVITGFTQLVMKKKCDGDFISSSGRVVGATLIGQKFEDKKYFWPRPSANDYNPLPSGGSNLGPTSKDLQHAVNKRREAIYRADPSIDPSTIPSELLFASGSGLDPHIGVETALFQVKRIATIRHLSKEALITLITEHTEQPSASMLCHGYVNVLKLNIALDQLEPSNKSQSEAGPRQPYPI